MTQKKKRFFKIHVEISNICNLQCTFCPEVIRTKKMIDVDLFRNIIQQIAPLTEQVAFHLMGEPLVHPKLETFVEICGELGVPIFLVSNGVLLTEKRAQILLNPAFRQVNFSLHSFPDNYPEKDPTEYLEKIFQFTERALVERPELYINYRLWNLQEVRGKGGRNQDLLDAVETRFGKEIGRTFDVIQNKSRKIKGRLYLHYDTEFVWPSPHLPLLGDQGTCHGLSQHFGILVDGTVVPCCLDKEGNIPLGNVRDATVLEILGNPRSQAILRGFHEGKLKEDLCQKCQYVRRFEVTQEQP